MELGLFLGNGVISKRGLEKLKNWACQFKM